jgi:hypothetical protein
MPTRLEEMRERCLAFHTEHPEVWTLFEQFTLDRIAKGFKRYSSDAIFHRIRWELSRPTYEKGKEFKLNDHYTTFYGRRFMRKYPQHEGYFRTRHQPSAARSATGLPEPGPQQVEPWYGTGAPAPERHEMGG